MQIPNKTQKKNTRNSVEETRNPRGRPLRESGAVTDRPTDSRYDQNAAHPFRIPVPSRLRPVVKKKKKTRVSSATSIRSPGASPSLAFDSEGARQSPSVASAEGYRILAKAGTRRGEGRRTVAPSRRHPLSRLRVFWVSVFFLISIARRENGERERRSRELP